MPNTILNTTIIASFKITTILNFAATATAHLIFISIIKGNLSFSAKASDFL